VPRRSEVIIILNEFRVAWNKKDLNGFASFTEKDIISINPALKIGIIPLKARSLHGIHHVLKSTKEI